MFKSRKSDIERSRVMLMSNTHNHNIQLVKSVIDVINSGDTTNVADFIGPTYYNHESQMDPVRSKMRGPKNFQIQ